ncbi:Hsp90 protein-domain-containing protein [Mycena polygramma]|nr:Hsp90 protein-domain-containing protein [Mycena polygramma]
MKLTISTDGDLDNLVSLLRAASIPERFVHSSLRRYHGPSIRDPPSPPAARLAAPPDSSYVPERQLRVLRCKSSISLQPGHTRLLALALDLRSGLASPRDCANIGSLYATLHPSHSSPHAARIHAADMPPTRACHGGNAHVADCLSPRDTSTPTPPRRARHCGLASTLARPRPLSSSSSVVAASRLANEPRWLRCTPVDEVPRLLSPCAAPHAPIAHISLPAAEHLQALCDFPYRTRTAAFRISAQPCDPHARSRSLRRSAHRLRTLLAHDTAVADSHRQRRPLSSMGIDVSRLHARRHLDSAPTCLGYPCHLSVKHVSVEGQLEFKAILVIPNCAPFHLFESKKKRNDIRSTFAASSSWTAARTSSPSTSRSPNIVKKCMDLLSEIAEDKDNFNKFYEAFAKKNRSLVSTSRRNRSKLAKFLRFFFIKSTEEQISLKDYIAVEVVDSSISLYMAWKKTLEANPHKAIVKELKRSC